MFDWGRRLVIVPSCLMARIETKCVRTVTEFQFSDVNKTKLTLSPTPPLELPPTNVAEAIFCFAHIIDRAGVAPPYRTG